ncbi:MAG TPA: formimidoylglutamate deiminase [Actinomycetes bacterium]|nr:formimidoylglutamate deiminase [Actinomycetes bacterium]
MPVTSWWCELAWLGGEAPASGVVLSAEDGRFTTVETGVLRPPAGATTLRGLVLPGLANVHSHAFHRALRGRALPAEGTFWTWRTGMYAVAERLDPDRMLALARATYAEMALAGITCVGEFHYLHHDGDGQPYADPNAMSAALATAAAEAGIRLTLLDTCYLSAGFGEPLAGVQRRFSDGTAGAWAARVDGFHAGESVRLGAAVHSVRAVPAADAEVVAEWARSREAPLHVHVSEQPAENAACEQAYGSTPTAWLHERGVLGPRTTAVHATHLTDDDLELLAMTGTRIGLCPTTERDLADGIGAFGRMRAAGIPLAVGSDSQAVIDLLEETRLVEGYERLRTGIRGHFSAAELLTIATASGHAALGWPEAGGLAVGAVADLVAVDLTSVRTSGGADADALAVALAAATAADVREVVVSGRTVVREGHHVLLGDVAPMLQAAIEAVVSR